MIIDVVISLLESTGTVLVGLLGLLIIAALMCLVVVVGLAIYMGIKVILYKFGLVKEPDWLERARELKELKASIR